MVDSLEIQNLRILESIYGVIIQTLVCDEILTSPEAISP